MRVAIGINSYDGNGFYIDMNDDITDLSFPWLFHPGNKLGIRTPIEIGKIPGSSRSREPVIN